MTVQTGQKSSDEKKELALGNFMVTIRDDLLKQKIVRKTNLTGENFKHLRGT